MTVRPSSPAMRYVSIMLFVVVLLASRGCRLGEKPLHHDESLFGYYSWYLSRYGEYEYDPILHGPLLLELTAGVFRLFGDSDATLRLVPFLCGLLMFPLLLALRPWLGRQGTYVALLLLLVSPTFCYYCRFLRNDSLFAMLTLANLVAIAHGLRGRSAWPLVLWPVSVALLISTKENVVFVAASQVGFAFLWVALDDRRIAAMHVQGERLGPMRGQLTLRVLKRLNVSLVLWCLIGWLYAWKIRPRVPLGAWAVPLWAVGVVATAAWLDAAIRALHHDSERTGLVFRLYRSLYTDPYWWGGGFALFVAIVYFCFSIMLTEPRSMFGRNGLIAQTLAYWWGEHTSERLGGPFHVYAPQLLLYEVPAWGLVLAALLRDWLRNIRARWPELAAWLGVALLVWVASLISMTPKAHWLASGGEGQVQLTIYDWLSEWLRGPWGYLHLRTTGALFWAASVAYWGLIWTARSIRAGRVVRGWFIFWLMTSYLFYGYAGEKVPWLALHIVLPLLLLAALLWDEWSGACLDRRRWGFVAAFLAALLAWNGWQMYVLCFANPTNPAEIAVYNHTHWQAKDTANQVLKWIEDGSVSEPSRVLVQGEASWPWTWYLRRYPSVQFVSDDFWPARTDEVVVTDPGVEDSKPILQMDFEGGYFALRYAWIPPPISFNELLCLRPSENEPDRFWPKMRFRLRRSVSQLQTLGRYILFRRAYSMLPSPAGDEPFGFIYCVLWVRTRLTPEPLMPPRGAGLLPADFDRTRPDIPLEIEDRLRLDEGPSTAVATATPVGPR